jgi:hypothetical protein
LFIYLSLHSLHTLANLQKAVDFLESTRSQRRHDSIDNRHSTTVEFRLKHSVRTMEGAADVDVDADNNAAPSASAMSTADVNPNDLFKILIASDIHLGYCDNNPARGEYSKNCN